MGSVSLLPRLAWSPCQDKILKLITPLCTQLCTTSLLQEYFFCVPTLGLQWNLQSCLLQERHGWVEQGFIKTSAMKFNVCEDFHVSQQVSERKSTYRINKTLWCFLMKTRNQEELKMGCGRKGSIPNSCQEKLGGNKCSKSYKKEELE